MKPEFIRIASSKANDPGMLDALTRIEALAAHYEDGEKTFPARINENKARRGEAPTKLRKAKRDQLEELAKDQAELDASLHQQLANLASAQAVVQALHAGMSANLVSSRGLLKYYHPDDLPLGQDMLRRQEALVSALADFLSTYGDAA